MAKKRHPMKMTPLMALSIMALGAMAIPIFSLSNNVQKTGTSNAASRNFRQNVVNYVPLDDTNPTRPTPTPSQQPGKFYQDAY